MANHKATIKSAKQSRVRRARNRYDKITTRNLIRKFDNETDSTKKTEVLPILFSHIDRLAKKNIIHKNKAANLKKKLSLKVKSVQKGEVQKKTVAPEKTISKKTPTSKVTEKKAKSQTTPKVEKVETPTKSK